MIEFIQQPWTWYVSGAMIALVLLLLLLMGKTFGVSSNFRTICAMCGAGEHCDFFKFDWKSQLWNLVFLSGSVVGGFISHQYLTKEHGVKINPDTVVSLKQELGFEEVGKRLGPDEIFGIEALQSPKGILILLIGGVLIGFGTRYAGGCTSGHAISGLSNLQLPSLIAVIGFFIGGLVMTYFILPLLF